MMMMMATMMDRKAYHVHHLCYDFLMMMTMTLMMVPRCDDAEQDDDNWRENDDEESEDHHPNWRWISSAGVDCSPSICFSWDRQSMKHCHHYHHHHRQEAVEVATTKAGATTEEGEEAWRSCCNGRVGLNDARHLLKSWIQKGHVPTSFHLQWSIWHQGSARVPWAASSSSTQPRTGQSPFWDKVEMSSRCP